MKFQEFARRGELVNLPQFAAANLALAFLLTNNFGVRLRWLRLFAYCLVLTSPYLGFRLLTSVIILVLVDSVVRKTTLKASEWIPSGQLGFYLSRLVITIAAAVLLSLWAIRGEAYNPWGLFLIAHLKPWLSWKGLWITQRQAQNGIVVLCGALFLVRDGTRFVRGVLSNFPKLVPRLSRDDEGRQEQGSESASTSRGEAIGMDEYRLGRTIGVLERLATYLLALLGQYSAIAFVLAAKSIARFRRIEEDPNFAEYYLVGTLASLLLAMVTAELVKRLLLN